MKTRIALFAISLLFIAGTAAAQIDKKDSLALVDFYNSTNGPNWSDNTNWLTKKPVSAWHGITVANRRVTKILLNSNLLKGALPSSIGNLDSMDLLFLQQNELSDTLPASIGNLAHIIEINLERNLITGPIPATVGRLSTMLYLSLSDNRLTGTIPDSLSRCSNLTGLLLGGNQLTGSLPSFLRDLPKIISVDVSYNRLSGKLPDIFPPGSQMFYFDIGHNQISGTIPSSIGNMKSLQTMNLYDNRLTGAIPNSIGQMTELTYTNMGHNKLTGNIPPSVRYLLKLQEFAVYENELTDGNALQDGGDQYFRTDIYVQKNSLTFNSLERLVRKYVNIAYSPQANIAVHSYRNKLAVSAGGTLSNNTYKWFRVGRAAPVATVVGDSTYLPVAGGNYYARVTNAVATMLTLKTDTVSFALPASGLQISLSPNPARDVVTLHGLDDTKDASVTIADMSGYVWMKMASHKQSYLQVNVSRLRAGNYLVAISNGEEIKTVPFVKE